METLTLASFVTSLVALITSTDTTENIDVNYSKKLCSLKEKKDTFRLPGAKSGERIEVSFECDESEIVVCQLPNMPRVLASKQPRQDFVGPDGRKYFVECDRFFKPDVLEDYSANVCATTEKAADVKYPGGKKINVKFECDTDLRYFQSCTPSGYEKLSVDGSVIAIIDGPTGKHRYDFTCDKNLEPQFRRTFAAEICALQKKEKNFWACKDLAVTVTFVSNAEKTRIKSCKPNGYFGKVNAGRTATTVDLSAKRSHFPVSKL